MWDRKSVILDPPRPAIYAPDGWHHCVLVQVRNHGLETSKYGLWDSVSLYFQIAWRYPTSGRRAIVSRRFRKSLQGGSILRTFLEAWMGRPFSPKEIEAGLNLSSLDVPADYPTSPVSSPRPRLPFHWKLPRLNLR